MSRIEVPDDIGNDQALKVAQQWYPEAFPAAPVVAEKKPQGGIFSDLFSAGAKGTKQMVSQSRTGIASLFGNAEEEALAGLERSKALEEKYKGVRGTDVEKIKAPWERGEYGNAALEAVSQSPYAIAENLPQIAGMGVGTIAGGALGTFLGPAGTAAGAVAGRALGATIGARIGEWLTSAAQQRGSNVERQAQEQIQKGEQVNIDSWKASTAAAGQGALDVLSFHMLGGAKFVGKILNKTEAEILKMPAATAERLVKESVAKTTAKGLGTGFLGEIPNELGQTLLERWQAGLDLTSPEALKEYGDTAIAVGLLAPLGSAGRFSEKSTARGVIKREESLTQFDRNLTGLINQNIASGQYPSSSDAYYSAIDQAKQAAEIGAHMTVYDSVGNEAPAVVTGRTEEGVPFIKVATEGSGRNYVLGQEFDLVNPNVMEARLSDGTSVEKLAALPGEDLSAMLTQFKQTVEANRIEQAKGNDLVQYHTAERDLATLVSAITNPDFVSLNKKTVGDNQAIAKKAIKEARDEKKKQDAAQTPLTQIVEKTSAPVAPPEAPIAPTETPVAPPEAPIAPTVADVAPTVAAPIPQTVAPVEIPAAIPPVAFVEPKAVVPEVVEPEVIETPDEEEQAALQEALNQENQALVAPTTSEFFAVQKAHSESVTRLNAIFDQVKQLEKTSSKDDPALIAAQERLRAEEENNLQLSRKLIEMNTAVNENIANKEKKAASKKRVRTAAAQTATAYLLSSGALAKTSGGTDVRMEIYGKKTGINQRLFSGSLGLDEAADMLRAAGWDIPEDGNLAVEALKRILQDEAKGIKHYAFKDQEETFRKEVERRENNRQAAAEAEQLAEKNRPLIDDGESTLVLPGDEGIPFSKTSGKNKAASKAKTEAQKLVATIKEERLNKRYQEALPRVAALIEARMKQLGLAKFIDVNKLKTIIVVGPDGKLSMEGKINGAYLEKVIQLAVAGKSDAQIMSTLNHEAIHAMRELGMITESEWKNLSKVVENKGWINLFQIPERYTSRENVEGKTEDEILTVLSKEAYFQKTVNGKKVSKTKEEIKEDLVEEAIADAFATYATGRSPIIDYLDAEQTKPVYVYKAELKLGGQPVGIITRIIKMLRGIRDVAGDEDVFKRIQEAPIAPTAVAVTPTAVAEPRYSYVYKGSDKSTDKDDPRGYKIDKIDPSDSPTGKAIYNIVDSGGAVFEAFDTRADAIDYIKNAISSVKFSKTPEFKRFAHGNQIINLNEKHKFADGVPVVVQVVHGTTGDYEYFDRSKLNQESDLGAAFYFTNTLADVNANYAGMGPDLTNKIDMTAERIANETDRKYNDPDVIEEARNQFLANEGQVMPVYVRFDNPVVLGGKKETFLDFQYTYNEELDEYEEPTGKLVDFVEALKDVASDERYGGLNIAGDERYGNVDIDKVVSDIYEKAGDNDGLSASDLIKTAKNSEGLVYAEDYENDGKLASNEIIRQAFENIGYDGFIDQTVVNKFSRHENIKGKVVQKPMEGINEDTVHFIAFKQNQIKSSVGNLGSYGERKLTKDELEQEGITAAEAEKRQKLGYIRYSATAKKLTPKERKEEVRRILAAFENHLLPEERKKLTLATAQKLVDLVKELPSANELTSVALAGIVKRGWYRHSAEAIANVFGGDGPRFTALLAATSPQTSVESNLRNALNIWKNWTLAGRPSDPRLAIAVNKGGVALALVDKVYDKKLKKAVKISRDEARKILADRGFPMELYGMAREQLKIMGDSVEGNRGEASVLDAWIGNSMRALNSEEPVKQILSGPKVNSFYRNLIGFVNEVTNDAWMANFSGVDQKIFAGGLNAKATEPGKGFGYMAMNVQVRKAANLLTKMTNDIWTPSEVQETIWSWAKTALELASEVGRPVQQLVRDKSITDDLINATPDFRTLFHAPEYQTILEGAGYAEQLRKLVAPSRDNELAAQKKSGAGSQTEEITPNPRHLIESARRLETLRQKRIREKAKTVARNKLSVAKYSGAKTTPATRIFGGSQIAPVWAMPNTTPSSDKIDNLRFLFQDRFLDLDKVIQAVKATGIQISDQFNAYLKETLFHGRVAKQSLDFTRQEIDPLLQDMKARGVSIGDIEKYLHNRHAEERNDYIATINTSFPDGGSGIKTQDARNYLNGLSPTQRSNYIAISAKIDAMMQKTNILRVSSGLAEQKLVDAWNNTYKHYVPLQRDMKDSDDETNQRSIGQGFSVSERMKRAMGSTYDVENILSNIVAERERIIVKAEKNNVTKSIFNLALMAPNTDFWLAVDIENGKNALKNLTSLLNMGLSLTDATNIAAEPMSRETDSATGHVVTRLNPRLRNADNVLHVMIDGKEKILIFNKKNKEANRLVRTLKNLDMQSMGYVMGSVANITRYFASVNTQYNPIFGVINFMRDVQTGLLNLTNTPIANKKGQVLADTFPALRGIWDQIRKDAKGQASTNMWGKLYQEFEKAGGPTGYREMFTTSEDRSDALAKEFKRLSEGKIKAGGRAVFTALSDYNTAMENAVRLAAYKAAKDSGLSIPQAAYLAKNLTVNFNKKGDLTREMGALYAFFNASVQGTARIAQTLAGPAGRKIISGGLLLGSMQAMLLAQAGFGDDEPPDFIKEKNIIIPTGNGKYMTIPMPLGFNLIPNTSRVLTEIMLEERPNLPKKLAGLFSSTFSALSPTGGGPVVQMLTPTIADPIVALAQNKDAFGRRIYKEDFSGSKPTAGYLRTKETATPWAKGLAEFLNYASGGTQFKQGVFSPTPDQIDYLIGQATGGVGREASKFAQTFTSLSTGEELPSYKVPLVSRFFGDTKETAAEANKFYENLKRLNEHGAELDGYRKNPGAGNVGEYLKENPEARLVAMARHTQEILSNINKQKRLAIQRELPKERVKQLEELARVQMHRLNDRIEALR